MALYRWINRLSLQLFGGILFKLMHDRAIYFLHSVAWKQTHIYVMYAYKYIMYNISTGTRLVHRPRGELHTWQTDPCIITSSGWRCLVSKAVGCHRNLQRTLHRKQQRRLSSVISTRPLFATTILRTHSTLAGDVVWGQRTMGPNLSIHTATLTNEMCQKDF